MALYWAQSTFKAGSSYVATVGIDAPMTQCLCGDIGAKTDQVAECARSAHPEWCVCVGSGHPKINNFVIDRMTLRFRALRRCVGIQSIAEAPR